ncbi:MAG: RNA methyltransferase [Acidobacteriota bacterium]
MKDIRRLRRSKGAQGRWLLEGPHLLGEAVAAGMEIEVTLASPDFLASPSAELGLPRPPLEIDPRLLDELTDSDSPRGVIAVVRRPETRPAKAPTLADGVHVYADGLQDPGNLGALARVIEASGAQALWTAPGTCGAGHPRALRASAGSLLRLPLAESVGPERVDADLADHSPTWVALATRGGTPLWEADLGGCLVLAVGAEGPGLSETVRRRADVLVTLPMAPPVESLNATVSAALVLFELRRRRR